MGSCNCGGKTVKFTPGKPKKASIQKGSIKKNPQFEQQPSAAVRKMKRQATRKATREARKNSGPCTCTQ